MQTKMTYLYDKEAKESFLYLNQEVIVSLPGRVSKLTLIEQMKEVYDLQTYNEYIKYV